MRYEWENNGKLQDEIAEALSDIPRKAIASNLTAWARWIKRSIFICRNMDWDNPKVRSDNIEGIVEAARAKAKHKGFDLSEKKEPLPKTYALTNYVRSHATTEKMRKSVEDVRLRYWETSSPPFAKTNEGRIKAEAWFSEQEERDLDSATHVPVVYEVKRLFHKEHDAKVAFGLVSDWGTAQMQKPGMTRLRFTQLCEQEAAMLSKFSKEQPPREIQIRIKHPQSPLLELPSNFSRRKVAAIEGQTLGRLKGDVQKLSRESGWWSESETVSHLLFGTVSARKVGWSYNETSREITLIVSGPATEGEVQEAYQNVLGRLGRKPVHISVQQEELLGLVAQMPDTTFPELFHSWQQKCEEQKGVLKTYANHKSLQSARYPQKSYDLVILDD